MAPKKITVVDASGGESSEKIANDAEFNATIADYGVRSLVDDEGNRVRGYESLEDGGRYTLGPPVIQQQQQQPNERFLPHDGVSIIFVSVEETRVRKIRAVDDLADTELSGKLENISVKQWFRVRFTVSRDKNHAGVRFRLVELAKGGYYPLNATMEEAFKCRVHPQGGHLRLISVDAVFIDEGTANTFVAEVDHYLVTTSGVTLYSGDLEPSAIAPFDPKRLILTSHYKPSEANGEPPLDSPVWNVEQDSVDFSHLSSYYSYSDTIYKYQRIETENAFARCVPEGAHIFPAAKCHGTHKWLDNKDFNRLALSGLGHQQFDGTARGRAKKAKTSPMVAIEPTSMESVNHSGAMFTRINLRLWCRNQCVATNWQPFVAATLRSDPRRGLPYFDGIAIFCEQQRRQKLIFEVQQEADGTERRVLATAIPGVENRRTLESWNGSDETVAVSEIMFSLLQWSFRNALDTWKVANQVE